jgi:glycosyltransferase involved in cell wall biosynthesis
MVSSLWPPRIVGGAELYAATLADHLAAEGHAVGAITLGVDGPGVVGTVRPWPARVDEVRSVEAWRRIAFHVRDVWRTDTARALRRAIERFRPDVVHTHGVHGMSVAALVAPGAAGVPHVHTLHDFWLRCWRSTMTGRSGAPCGRSCRAIAAWRAGAQRRHGPDVTIAISRAILERHPSIDRAGGARVLLHPLEAPRPRPARRHDGDVVFGYLGQLNPNKGVALLLEASRAVPHRLLVAGTGRLSRTVSAAAGPDLEYLGWVSGPSKEAFFDAVDCLVVPSTWPEPAGLVVNEAVARGVPVIASTAGGLPEYVPAECRSLLVPPGDVPALAAAMSRFAADPAAHLPAPPDPGRSWSAHVAAVLDAYAGAGAGAQRVAA